VAAEKVPKLPKLKAPALAEAAASHSLKDGARCLPLPQSSKKDFIEANASADADVPAKERQGHVHECQAEGSHALQRN
jgi:hypothetical protein